MQLTRLSWETRDKGLVLHALGLYDPLFGVWLLELHSLHTP